MHQNQPRLSWCHDSGTFRN